MTSHSRDAHFIFIRFVKVRAQQPRIFTKFGLDMSGNVHGPNGARMIHREINDFIVSKFGSITQLDTHIKRYESIKLVNVIYSLEQQRGHIVLYTCIYTHTYIIKNYFGQKSFRG